MKKCVLFFGVVLGSCCLVAAQAQQSSTSSTGNTNAEESLQQLQQMLAQSKTQSATGTQPTGTSNATNTSSSTVPTSTSTQNTASQVPSTQTTATSSEAVDSDTAIKKAAFSLLMGGTLPLSVDQIATLHDKYEASQKAAAAPSGVPPKPVTTSRIVDLSPGATPPILRLGRGFVSSLDFVDASGEPWPVQSYDIGDPQSFNVSWNRTSNILMVQAITGYKAGNLAVLLKDLPTPVLITLLPGQSAVDYRADFRIPRLGPNAAPSQTNLPTEANKLLLNVLNGLSPIPGCGETDNPCKPVTLEGGSGDAWALFGKIYLRTRLVIISPGFISTMSSLDGTHAYTLPQAPILVAMQNGKTMQLTVKGQ